MGSFRLALSLARIPRLFASLFLFPLLISFALVYGQLIVTGLAIKSLDTNQNSVEQRYQRNKSYNFGRKLLYGDGAALGPLITCRWIFREAPNGSVVELPPSKECQPDRLDVALHVPDPATFDTSEYEAMFQGNIERLHICKTCHPDLIISVSPDGNRAEGFSAQALVILSMTRMNDNVHEHFIEAVRNVDHLKGLLGEIYFHSEDFRGAVKVNELTTEIALMFNIAMLVVISLWLALKAHRRVLDYFARSGALLPMVAATGKGSFYSALWILTALRVGAFLAGAVPITYYGFTETIADENAFSFLSDNPLEFSVWLIAIVLALALATLIASIADLKHRHHLLSFAFKYIPLFVCSLGAFIWIFSFLIDGPLFSFIRSCLSALPIIGMAPIVIAPIFKPQLSVLIIHAMLTCILIILAMKRNSRWFAAHLEEL